MPDKASPKWVTIPRETHPKEDTSSPSRASSSSRDRDLIEPFIQHQKAKGIRSLRKLPYLLGVFFSWLEDHGFGVADLTPLGAEEFQTYLATKEEDDGVVHYASGTVADIVQAVDAFYKTLADDGLVFQNPFYGLRHIKREQRLPRTVPTEAEMADYLKRLGAFDTRATTRERRNWYRLHVIAELLYATGMRVGELATLRPSDFDFEAKTVYIRSGKGGVDRTAYLNDYAVSVVRFYITQMRELVNHCHDTDTLFGVASARNLDEALNPYFKALGGFTSHSFRHAVGTHLLRRGCDLRFIQIILGHDDLKSTALYTRVSKEELRDQLDSFHPRKEV